MGTISSSRKPHTIVVFNNFIKLSQLYSHAPRKHNKFKFHTRIMVAWVNSTFYYFLWSSQRWLPFLLFLVIVPEEVSRNGVIFIISCHRLIRGFSEWAPLLDFQINTILLIFALLYYYLYIYNTTFWHYCNAFVFCCC